jgi:hypothetical protein
MNCLYCDKLTQWIATEDRGDGYKRTCQDCRSYFHAANSEIYLTNSLRIEGANRKYLYMTLPLENIAHVYIHQDEGNIKVILALTLNHIPDWHPKTMGVKIDRQCS